MLIRKKLNLLIIGIISSIFIGLGIFVLNFVPVINMRLEKDSLFTLNSAISELRADINKLGMSSFNGQLDTIKEKHKNLLQSFTMLDEVEHLKADPEIEEALMIIERLYSLYESNYSRLMTTSKELSIHLDKVFLSDQVKLYDVKQSRMLERYAQKDVVLTLIDSLNSTVTILDSNLVSTFAVVNEQFTLINELIYDREIRAYVTGIIIIIIVGIVSVLFGLIITGKITRNIRYAGSVIRVMSNGDISKEINIKSNDELRQLGADLNILNSSLKNAFNSMKNSSNKGVQLKEELVTSGNQTFAAATQIASNSQAISNQFTMLSERVQGAAEANQSMKGSLQSLDEYVQDQTAMVEESTSAVTEMISSINNVAEITSKKKAATETLVRTAEAGGSKLNATILVINEINESLDQIKGTATIIQQIASQTNLLAMNAAIEAAHAGDAGRGFAVVADEIRKLAEASSMNSKQISGVLKEVVTRIESASASGHETETAFIEIDREVKGVAQSLDEISSSMEELNIGGSQILEAMTGLQDVSIKVNDGNNKMNDSSRLVTEAIEVVSRITTEVSESANEITIGITEVSGAMQLVTELSNSLGEITDKLEEEAARFKTDESESVAEAVAVEETEGAESEADAEADASLIEIKEPAVSAGDIDTTTVTISDGEGVSLTIEPIEEL